jgi:predicted permease
LAQELSSHIELQTRKYIAQGLDSQEAYRRARIDFGGMEEARESCREVDRWRFFDAASRNGRQSFRSLAKSPAFALIAVLILSVGIGANVAVFSAIDALLLRPLPVPEPNELVQIVSRDKHGKAGGLFSPVLEPLSQNRSFSGVCGIATHYDAVEIDGTLRKLGSAALSGDCFRTLGIAMERGRALDTGDDHLGAGHVAVITDALWHTQFAGRDDVLGQSIRMGTTNYTVVGVTAAPFSGLLLGFPEPIMVPLLQQFDLLPNGSPRTSYYVNVLARRAPGVSQSQAAASILVQRRILLEQSVPQHYSPAGKGQYLSLGLTLSSAASGLDYFLRDRFSEPLYAVFGLCGAMLLMACLNLSSLLLARSFRRRQEVGIRLALGATLSHVVSILFLENLFLIVSGTVVGILGGLAAARVILARAGAMFGNFYLDVGIDFRVIVFVLATVGAVVTVFLLGSIWQARRLAGSDTLKQSGRGLVAPNTGAQKILLGVQIALTLVLIAGSALFNASLTNSYSIDFGVKPQQVWTALLNPQPGGYRNPVYWQRTAATYYRGLLERIETLPGVTSATFSDNIPFFNNGYPADISLVEGGESERASQARISGVADGYFSTLGARLIEGEDFRRALPAASLANGEPGVIISQSLATQLSPKRSPLGLHIRIGTQPDLQRLRIVGISSDMDTSLVDLNETKPFLAFLNFWEHADLQGYPTLVIKTRGPNLDAAAIRRIVARQGYEFVERLSPLTNEIDNALVENRFLAYLSTAFGCLALLMAAVGLFGLLSYQVANRTAEIGIRMALGARQQRIRWLILGQVVKVLLAGVVAGVALSFGVEKVLGSLLYGVTLGNPGVLALSIVVLLGAAFAAATIPLWRATHINPIEALRSE